MNTVGSPIILEKKFVECRQFILISGLNRAAFDQKSAQIQ